MEPKRTVLYAVRVGMVTGIFAAGFICGSWSDHSANAQLGNVGSEVLKKAGSSGGIVGSVVELGTAINDMEKQVSGLQKNLGILRKVKAALGG